MWIHSEEYEWSVYSFKYRVSLDVVYLSGWISQLLPRSFLSLLSLICCCDQLKHDVSEPQGGINLIRPYTLKEGNKFICNVFSKMLHQKLSPSWSINLTSISAKKDWKAFYSHGLTNMTGGIKGHYSKRVTHILMRVVCQLSVYLSSA